MFNFTDGSFHCTSPQSPLAFLSTALYMLPCSGFYSASPDDAVFQLVARDYSSKHRTMWTNVNCKVTSHYTDTVGIQWRYSGDEMINNLVIKGDNFPGGITNGAQWYDVPGGMQVCNSRLRLNMNTFLISITVIMFRILTTCTATRLRSRLS